MKSNRGYPQTLDNCERFAQKMNKKLWNYKLDMAQSFSRELRDSAIKIIQEVTSNVMGETKLEQNVSKIARTDRTKGFESM